MFNVFSKNFFSSKKGSSNKTPSMGNVIIGSSNPAYTKDFMKYTDKDFIVKGGKLPLWFPNIDLNICVMIILCWGCPRVALWSHDTLNMNILSRPYSFIQIFRECLLLASLLPRWQQKKHIEQRWHNAFLLPYNFSKRYIKVSIFPKYYSNRPKNMFLPSSVWWTNKLIEVT